jgi:DNA primase
LIEAGFDFTVASLGTAFGDPHVEQLRAMGVEEVYLTFDQDEAGQTSAEKAGHLLMKKGIGVRIVGFSDAKDPDELLMKKGKTAFFQALAEGTDYLPFLMKRAKATINWSSPREKDRAVRLVETKIREWENPILVYESLKQLACLADVPESLLNVGSAPVGGASLKPPPLIVLVGSKEQDVMLELDLVRWLVIAGPENELLVAKCSEHVAAEDFTHDVSRQLFALTMERLKKGERPDFMSFAAEVNIESVSSALKTLLSRPQRVEKALPIVAETVKKIKERNWLRKREVIRKKMEGVSLSDEELNLLAREFDQLTRHPPTVPEFLKN